MKNGSAWLGVMAFFVCVTGASGFDFEEHYGWYSANPSRQLLFSPSAHRGLFVADFQNFRSGSIRLDDHGRLVWIESGESTVIEFTPEGHVASELTVLARKMDTARYGVREVEYGDDPRLVGTLFTPATANRTPGVVMIHGSGASDRDNLWYQAIADRLATEGLAVLLPDKRGSGKSAGNWESADLGALADDALEALAFLKQQAMVDPTAVGLLGVSQGGRIAPMAATSSQEVSFVINLSGAGVPLNEQLVHELGGGVVGHTRAALTKMRNAEWWKRNGDIDPVDYWRRLDIPALIVYGEDDERDNVPVNLSTERLDQNRSANGELTVRVYQNTGHGLMDSDIGKIREDFLTDLVEWIANHSSSADGTAAN